MRIWFLTFILFCTSFLHAQEKVSFFSSDSLKITADLYLKDYQLPFIILLHQEGSSRGEYLSIAPKLLNLGYNCLSVDLRSGDKINYVSNETAERAKQMHLPAKFIDTEQDIFAAIKFVRKYNRRPIILFGSSYSASLAFVIAQKSDDVKAVVAFSPGEYFLPTFQVKDSIIGFNKPVFAASSEMEYKYVTDLLADISDKLKTLYKPSSGRGVHGAKALWEDSESSRECWFQLTYFFAKLKEF